ncbi:carbon-nitrogen hydrolase family protein [Cereibacter azotoformans]|uniref:Putative amidohydrolase n=1 Tax=Cereibacter azotoformans TaxID=43057 RepID=A0A2T5K701_9RHOB|nr:carbon-nitrogen hydrolase family protein [Cereibacter azotoformans]AXQ92822.1 amidohydrolase [Cereibacter sphaeroides]MBO4169512.1 carbon-nitrogen hydrolase family protein [Cereibacter azotoformans]PTR18190.1 putative amidohydrolase [Cereibacter azotoformans]UIJ31105.1 carbon-nitrogen hydrolase family protein [Cereibacter azotoformans]
MKIAAAAYPLDWFDRFADYEAKITGWVARAAEEGADLLVFPEYGAMELASLGGRAVAADLEAALHEVARHGPAVGEVLRGLAEAHHLHILGPSAPVFEGARPVNRAVLYGPSGVIGHQDKLIMTRFERETWDVVPGGEARVFDTALGRIGVVICYDSEFPLLARAMVERGAEILLAPSCTDSLAGFTRVRVGAMARALENQCVVVHAPTVGPCDFCPAVDENVGRAAIYGPPDNGWPATGILAETGLNEPGWAFAEVDREAIARVRREGHVLNHAHWAEQEVRLARGVAVL